MVAIGRDEDGGVMTAPTLLLIHGFLDAASVWDGFVDAIGGELATVRYELPGFGDRRGSADAAAVTLETLAAEAGAVLGGIDGPVIVVGQSLGTQVAELVAAQHPTQVRGLVLITPVPLGGTRLPDDAIAPFKALGGDREGQRAARMALSPHLDPKRLDALVTLGSLVDPDVAAHYVDVWNDGLHDAPPRSGYQGPVLIVRGGSDGFVTEQLVDDISPRFYGAELEVVDAGGHWVHVEYPDAVAAAVLDFADSVTATA